jgi:hypothetical protein
VRRDRVEIAGLGFEWPNIGLIHNFDNVLGYNPVRLGEIIDAMGASETVAEPRQRIFTPLFPSYRSMLADLLGIRYIAVGIPVEEMDKRLKPGDLVLVAHTKDGYIYENPRALPRVLFAANWQLADFGAMVQDGHWPDFDPRKTVLLEKTPSLAGQPAPAQQSDAKLVLAAYQNTAAEIEVDAPAAGFVVLNDVWHPWWVATVDGKPAPIYRANVLFRAVQVPAGRHTVRFEFKPVTGAFRELFSGAKRKTAPEASPGTAPADVQPRPEAMARGLQNAPGTVPKILR